MLPLVGVGLAACSGNSSPPPSTPPAATQSTVAAIPTITPSSTVVVETTFQGTLVQFEEDAPAKKAVEAPATTNTPATTDAPTTTAPPTTTVTPTTTASGPAVIRTEGLPKATRVTPPEVLEQRRVEAMLPWGVGYQGFMNQVKSLGLESRQVTPELVGVLTQTGNVTDIRLWDKASQKSGLELHDLTTATVAKTQEQRDILTWDAAVLANFYQQWGGELAGNSPQAIQTAARDFAARKTLGRHFKNNPAAYIQAESSQNPGWLDLNFPQGQDAVWKDVITRVTNVAVRTNSMESWFLPRPDGRNEIEATFGKPGTGQVNFVAKIDPGGAPREISAHHKVAPKIEAAFEEINARGLSHRLHSYGGLFGVRAKRTKGEYSTHSWGIAMDINSAEYPLGTMIANTDDGHKAIAGILDRYGFHQVEGDAHHFQYATGY